MSESKPARRGRKTDVGREGGRPWAARFRAARVNAGMTVAQLALAAGLTQSAVERYDAGDRTPSVVVGVRLARALSTTAEELFG